MNGAITATSAAADRIRIEDEVWEEAFASRVSSRRRRPVAVKTRPAQSWFAESPTTLRPFGVDPPAELDPPFAVDPSSELDPPLGTDPGAPAPYGVHTSQEIARASYEALDPPQAASRALLVTAPGRRTIQITGRPAERNLVLTGRDSYAATRPRRALLHHRSGFEPDRLAMWAMLLGVALMAVAILSSSL